MIATLALLLAAPQAAAAPDPAIERRVARVLAKAPVIDGHNDLPWEIRERHEAKVESLDLTTSTAALPYPLQTDIPRLKKGGVGGQFWSVYIPATVTGPRAVEMTLEEIDIVRRFVAANPSIFEMATTAADVRRILKAGKVASLLGIEGGHQIDGRLSVLRQMRELGVGYMTLTHGKSLDWADSSTDTPRAGGLSEFGRKVVMEMNRIGMLVDVSHIADTTMAAALDVTKAPVIASHSSARALADRPRNIPDALLARIGQGGGVVMVNFYPAFLSKAWNDWDNARGAYAKSVGVPTDAYGPKSPAPLVEWDRTHPMPRVDASTVADHIEHVAKVAGKGAVGFGGDYDGIGGTGPEGMSGVDSYPLVLAELARRGWSDTDLAGLTSGNVLRVIARAEEVAKSMRGMKPIDATEPE
ncbi:dipeptidase [Sphingomonas donggukensis]|uniref:Dipeptidase n=1 Tax=Sphingomonas donggukensis TaxID=2949093 RepID=A0ABY4TSH4_9SPHN|nr:dipeptidase [Sphingomonas donggukensis]URW75232.1 dipeptidase [Sphingomonas donggukensis]